MEAAFCIETLEDTLARYGKPEIFDTGQGSQFTGQTFTDALADNGIAISMDGKGAWRDNVFVERLWRSLKYEEVYLRAYDSVSEARSSIGRYFDFYNGRRPHVSLDGNTPLKPTSTGSPSAWQPNPGKDSTYRCGKSIQRTGTTTKLMKRLRQTKSGSSRFGRAPAAAPSDPAAFDGRKLRDCTFSFYFSTKLFHHSYLT